MAVVKITLCEFITEEFMLVFFLLLEKTKKKERDIGRERVVEVVGCKNLGRRGWRK